MFYLDYFKQINNNYGHSMMSSYVRLQCKFKGGEKAKAMVKRADKALYSAKNARHNRFVCSTTNSEMTMQKANRASA